MQICICIAGKLGAPGPSALEQVRDISTCKPIKKETCYYGQVQTPFNFLIFPGDFL